MSFSQDLDMIGDWEHGEVSRQVINNNQDVLAILDKEDDNKNVDYWYHLLSVFGTEICGFNVKQAGAELGQAQPKLGLS